MATAVKSFWESGRLVFRRRDTLAGICAINPSRLTTFMSVTAIEDDDAELTAAAIKGGIVTYEEAACGCGGTLSFCTGADLDEAFPGIEVGECIEFYIQNVGTQAAALGPDDACAPTVTVLDTGQTIGANEGAVVLLRKTATGEYTAYCVGA